jgi:hypothetical protein
MFHTYVLTAARRPGGGVKAVDFDRASFLMDKDLLQQALDAMAHERDTDPRHDAIYDAQWVWDYYVERHREKYEQPFRPDIDPTWDT